MIIIAIVDYVYYYLPHNTNLPMGILPSVVRDEGQKVGCSTPEHPSRRYIEVCSCL